MLCSGRCAGIRGYLFFITDGVDGSVSRNHCDEGAGNGR